MEPVLVNGDYVYDGRGGIRALDGPEGTLNRVLLKLSACRGRFPHLPSLGSRLYTLPRMKASERRGAARQFVAEALQDEADLRVTEVEVTSGESGECVVRAGLVLESSGYSPVTLEITL
ncbi:hypothetical protein LJC32_04965 [Oscillospiraceae bacterium OttesenSCG-928-F05]|nr:hypothetical protein [Oscillospiraceae bacterium OttesenSCG-928-F05]